MRTTHTETYRGAAIHSEVAGDGSFAFVMGYIPYLFNECIYYDPMATRDETRWFMRKRRTLPTALRMLRAWIDETLATQAAVAAVQANFGPNLVCDCPNCTEYAYSHTRIADLKQAQEAALLEAGWREVAEIAPCV